MAVGSQIGEIKEGLRQLSAHILKVRAELSSIRHPDAATDRIGTMSDQLDAIVADTEGATNTILGAVEEIGLLAGEIGARSSDPEVATRLTRLDELASDIFQACTFQDITGQRITQVVTSLKFLDQRINALLTLWGRNELAEAPPAIPKTSDGGLVNGPQLKGQAISQDDIDALFK